MTAPLAADLAVTTAEETRLEEIALTIIDPDPDESHVVTLATLPSHGSATVVGNIAAYEPAPDFNGEDHFTLQVTDAYGLQLAEAAKVTVQVTPVNDPPTAANLSLTTAEDTPLQAIALAINDPDAQDVHKVTLATVPTHGSATVVDNLVTYEPAPNFHGEDHFTLQVTDTGGLQLPEAALVTIQVTPVNDAPLAANLTITTAEDTPLSGIMLAISDPDIADTHTVVVASPPVHGSVDLIDNVISYQPAQDFSGQDQFALQVTDGFGLQLAEAAQVTVQVTPVNDAPIAANRTMTVAEDTVLQGITLTITDPDPDEQHTLLLVALPTHGSVSVQNNLVSYRPAQNFNGEDYFALQVTDAAGLQLAKAAQVTVQVTPVNDPPTAAHAAGSGVNDGSAIPVPVTVQDPDLGDTFTLQLETLPDAGSVQISSQLHAQGLFMYTPHAGFAGVDHFTFRVADRENASIVGTAAVTVTLDASLTPSPTASPTSSLTPSPTLAPEPSATSTLTPVPTLAPTLIPTALPTASPTPTPNALLLPVLRR